MCCSPCCHLYVQHAGQMSLRSAAAVGLIQGIEELLRLSLTAEHEQRPEDVGVGEHLACPLLNRLPNGPQPLQVRVLEAVRLGDRSLFAPFSEQAQRRGRRLLSWWGGRRGASGEAAELGGSGLQVSSHGGGSRR